MKNTKNVLAIPKTLVYLKRTLNKPYSDLKFTRKK